MVVGGLKSEPQRRAVAALAQHLNWPLIADIGSGLRGGEHRSRIDHYDLLLTSHRFIREHKPDRVLQIGSRLTSQRLPAFLENSTPDQYIQMLDHPFRHDPIRRVTDRLQADIELGCKQLVQAVPAQQTTEWFGDWKLASQTVDAYLEKLFTSASCMTESLVAHLLSGELAEGSVLWAASSMPIRDLDQFYNPRGRWVPVGCNRGASGIDGTVASAAGYSLGAQKHVTLLIGDLAMLHDLNSLALLHDEHVRMTIVVINNNGGGIFGHLQIAGFAQLFEKYFVTPHGLNFTDAAKMFSLDYYCAKRPDQFIPQYRKASQQSRVSILEIPINRLADLQFYTMIVNEIAARLDGE
jgi:2-succinyl-5-enolpyruvyl-6-hydroxy-3-cyclohexene-1-carboxylate synthase